MARKDNKEKKAKQAKKPKAEKISTQPPKMRSAAPGVIGAWVLIFFILFTIGFGIFKIIRSPTEKSIENVIDKQISNLDNDTLARTKAVSFAERFAIEYFSYSEGSLNFTEKMEPFCADGLSLNAPSTYSTIGYVGTSGVEVDGNKVNVDVTCNVAYAVEDKNVFDTVQFITLRVPIEIDKKGNCSVVATPIYVANSNNPKDIDSVMMSVSGDNSIKDLDVINDTIKNFFTAYYKGSPSELMYFVTKNYGTPATIGQDITVDRVDASIEPKGDA